MSLFYFAWTYKWTKEKPAKFNPQPGWRKREKNTYLNIWYHGQGDCLFLHPMDVDRRNNGRKKQSIFYL